MTAGNVTNVDEQERLWAAYVEAKSNADAAFEAWRKAFVGTEKGSGRMIGDVVDGILKDMGAKNHG
ncbi:MAG: hypothetical protein KF895_03100 [Parvibaculum sp.]|nr:hypothetical protein [Parvibaculum sp.]